MLMNENLIGKEEVLRIAKLARLSFEDREAEQLSSELSGVLKHFGVMQNADTTAVLPMAHSMDITNVLRPDDVKDSLDRGEVLSCAPAVSENRFLVPKIIREAP